MAISPAVRAEVEDVLGRPKVRQRFKSLTSEAVAIFLNDLDRLTTTKEVARSIMVLPRDPKDEPYLNLALTAGAKYLVTWDNDLLSLMGNNHEGTKFRERFPGLVILTPVAFLRELGPPIAVAPTEKDPGETTAG